MASTSNSVYHETTREELPWLNCALASLTPAFKVDQLRLCTKYGSLRQTNDRRLKLNIGGQMFETWTSTLERFPNTLLGSRERENYFISTKQEYFIDRDPSFFRHILNFYRTGTLHFSNADCGVPYEDELKFYRISSHLIGLCCYDEFDSFARGSRQKKKQEAKSNFIVPLNAEYFTRRQRLHNMFENPNESIQGSIIFYIIAAAIVTSIVATVVETVSCGDGIKCGEAHKTVFQCMETVCVALFSCEFIIRLYAVPERKAHMKSFTTLVDLFAIIPFYLTLTFGSLISQDAMQPLVTMRAFRIFRVFKFMRSSERLIGLGKSLKESAPDLLFISALIGLGVIIFSILIFYIERLGNVNTFQSIPEAMWLGVQTMTTLGYGDVTPTTSGGKFFAALFCISGILIIALPVPVIQMRERLSQHQDSRG